MDHADPGNAHEASVLVTLLEAASWVWQPPLKAKHLVTEISTIISNEVLSSELHAATVVFYAAARAGSVAYVSPASSPM